MARPQPKYDRTLLGAGNLASEPGSPEWAIAVRLRIQGFLKQQNSNAFHLENMVSMMKDREGWRHLKHADGSPFRSYDDFAAEKEPFGLEAGAEKIEQIIAFRKHGGDRKSPKFKNQGRNPTLIGRSSEYLTARLERDRPDILEAFNQGEYKSLNQAAIAAGFVKKRSNLESAKKAFEKLTKAERKGFLKWAWAAEPSKS